MVEQASWADGQVYTIDTDKVGGRLHRRVQSRVLINGKYYGRFTLQRAAVKEPVYDDDAKFVGFHVTKWGTAITKEKGSWKPESDRILFKSSFKDVE